MTRFAINSTLVLSHVRSARWCSHGSKGETLGSLPATPLSSAFLFSQRRGEREMKPVQHMQELWTVFPYLFTSPQAHMDMVASSPSAEGPQAARTRARRKNGRCLLCPRMQTLCMWDRAPVVSTS